MKAPKALIIMFSALCIYPAQAAAQDEDCWHYEDGDGYIVSSLDTLNSVRDMDVSGDFVYVAADARLYVVDITDPQNPLLVGSTPEAGIFKVAVSDTYAFCLAEESHPRNPNYYLKVVNVADPQNPVIAEGGIWVGGGSCMGLIPTNLVAQNNIVCVALWPVGTVFFDVTNPADPQWLSGCESGGDDVVISGDYVFVSKTGHFHQTCGTGLRIISIADPINPVTVAEWNTYNEYCGYGLALRGDYLYLGGFCILDVSEPTIPVLVGAVETDAWIAGDLKVSGNFAYVTNSGPGIQVIDITVPSSPVILGGLDTPGRARDVCIVGNYVYVAGGGLQIALLQCAEAIVVDIDIKPNSDSNPINCRSSNGVVPVAILTTDLFDATTVDHTTVKFGPDEAAETHENPHGPVRHEEDVDSDGDMDLMFHFRFNETGIQCGDSEVTLTGQTYDGMAFSGTDQISTVPSGRGGGRQARLFQVNPNPFNPKTTLSFSLDRPQRATVSVFDVTGRRVAVIADQAYGAGPHTVEWNGQDTSGRAASSGTYLVRLETADRVEARKVMLIR